MMTFEEMMQDAENRGFVMLCADEAKELAVYVHSKQQRCVCVIDGEFPAHSSVNDSLTRLEGFQKRTAHVLARIMIDSRVESMQEDAKTFLEVFAQTKYKVAWIVYLMALVLYRVGEAESVEEAFNELWCATCGVVSQDHMTKHMINGRNLAFNALDDEHLDGCLLGPDHESARARDLDFLKDVFYGNTTGKAKA